MSEREKILGRIREALKVEAHLPGSHGHAASPTGTAAARRWLPAVGTSLEEQLTLFKKNAAELKAEFVLLNSAEEVRTALVALRDRENWKRVASHSSELTNAICPPLNLPLLRTDKNYDATELEKCDAGISECDALIAQTGSVLVTNRSAGGRALSVLPPHHVVLARKEQLLPDLPAAFELLKKKYGDNFPSMISFITGPSRTGDIERILVLGAHGPKKLTIFCF
ncbi:MAG TPA: LUD domain-containing protein [Candidatus Sulfotelmatobacter sp.]|jgi:L-lactate dehydrogenase complex protein LldG|nr:LUD domain-containing protein [Candidatus Sulfotelmatobacter sp.]